MDYQTAQAHFNGRAPTWRKVGRRTHLRRDAEVQDEPIYLRFWETDIITYFPDGRFVIDHGGHPTMTTKDRIRRFAPGGCTLWNDSRLRVLYLWTPKGPRPWKNGAHFNAKYARLDLTAMNSVNATDVAQTIRRYSVEYVRKLVFHGMPDPGGKGDCAFCAQRVGKEIEAYADAHYLSHIRKGQMPSSLGLAAALCDEAHRTGTPATDLEEMVATSWASRRNVWKPIRTYQDALARAEADLMGQKKPRLVPTQFRGDLRCIIESYLLLQLGFEFTREVPRRQSRGFAR